MTESQYWSPSSDSVISNEESSTRTFQRTTSAQVTTTSILTQHNDTQSSQVTLDEANAMLAEFDTVERESAMDTNNDTDDGSGMRVDPDKDWDLDSIDP